MTFHRGFLTALVVLVAGVIAAGPASAAGPRFSPLASVPNSGLAPENLDVARGADAAYLAWGSLQDASTLEYVIRVAVVRPGQDPAPAQVISGQRSLNPQVAAYEGGAAVVWADGDGVELARLSDQGALSSTVELTPEVSAVNPQVVAAPDGSLTLIYAVKAPGGRAAHIEAAYVSPTNEVTTERVSRRGWIRDPALASAADGPALAVWERRTNGNRVQRLETARLAANGVGKVRRIKTRSSRLTLKPRVAVGPQGAATVVWETDSTRRQSAKPDTVGAVRISPRGIPGDSHLVAKRSNSAFEPEVAVDSRGRVSVVYLERSRIHLSRLDGDAQVRNELSMRDGPGRFPGEPTIAFASRNRATLAWSHCCGKRSNLVVAQARSRGRVQGPRVLFAGDAQAFGGPELAAAAGAAPVLAWPLGDGIRVSFAR